MARGGGSGTVRYQDVAGLGSLAIQNVIDLTAADTVTGELQIANGGTAATTPQGARLALLPSVTGNALKVLRVNAGATDYELVAPVVSVEVV